MTDRHRHQLSWRHSNVSGFRHLPDGSHYGATWGTCDACGESITQLTRDGETLASNRRGWVALTDLEDAYAANAEADADTVESVGLDSTGRDGDPRFPYTLADVAARAHANWQALQDELNMARDSWGWDDPRTRALEDAEANACELYLATSGGF